MKKNKKLLDKVFMWIWILWFVLVESLFFSMFDKTFNEFITTIGVFFIPLMSAVGVILFLIWFFIFKYNDLHSLKKLNGDVYKQGNSQLEVFNKIASEIDKGIGVQIHKEYEELKEKASQIAELEKEKVTLKKIKEEVKVDIIRKSAEAEAIKKVEKEKANEWQKGFESY